MPEELESDVKLEPFVDEEEDEKPSIDDEELSSCLICNETKTRKIGELDKLPSLQGCRGNVAINQQLWSVFVLRNLVQYPKEKVAGLLKDTGGRYSLSDWFVLCESCVEIAEEAMVVFQKLLKLESKFKDFQEKVKLKISSLSGQRKKDTVSLTGRPFDVTAKIREHFKGNQNKDLGESHAGSDSDASSDHNVVNSEYPIDNSDDDYDKTDPLYIPSAVTKMTQVANIIKKSSLDRARTCETSYSYSELMRRQRNKLKKRLASQAKKGVQITCKICLGRPTYTNSDSYQRHMKDHCDPTRHGCPKCKFPCANARALRSHIARNCKLKVMKKKQENAETVKEVKVKETEARSTTLRDDDDSANSSIKGDGDISDNDEDWPLVNETEDDDVHGSDDEGNGSGDNVNDREGTQTPIRITTKPKSIQKKRPTNSIPPKEYSCKICLTTCLFATSWSFARHKQQHKLSKFPCPKCRYPCKTNAALQVHLRGNECNQRTCYKCDFCDFTTDVILKFIQHKSVHRKERQSEQLGTEDLNFSEKRSRKGCQITCKICLCQRVYTNMASYSRHLKYHQYRSHSCPKCNYPCQSEKTLQVHQSRNLCNLRTELEFACDFCDWKTTESKAALLKHRLEVHKEKRKYVKKKREEQKIAEFKCTYCSFKTMKQIYLDEHVKRHELFEGEQIDGKIKCKFCATLCMGPLALRRHVREKHFEQLGLPIFKCSTCGKNFARNNDLKFHMAEAHTKRFRFYCDICGYGTMRKHEFSRHMTYRHSDDKKFVCELCAAPFKTNVNLRTHLKKVHDPEKKCSVEYICKYCVGGGGNKFLNKSLLDRHLKDKHKDMYVHKCDECENSYLSVASLQLHKKINHSGQQGECQFCGVKVLNRVYLYSHYKSCQKKPDGFKYKYPRN